MRHETPCVKVETHASKKQNIDTSLSIIRLNINFKVEQTETQQRAEQTGRTGNTLDQGLASAEVCQDKYY